MTSSDILSRLQGVRRSPNGWMARCPAHEDRSPSLSVREGEGKVLLHCFAACSIEAICAAIGVRVSDLFTAGNQRRIPVPTIVRQAERELAQSGLRSRLTPADRERPVTVIFAARVNPDPAIARALALAVEGEVVQLAFAPEEGAR